MYFLSAVALVLVCMGLYGLVSYNLTRRLKEFSVRKVFGASLFQIFRLMNHDYLWIVLIAFGLGAPLGFYMMGLVIRAAYPRTYSNEPVAFCNNNSDYGIDGCLYDWHAT